MSIFKRKAKKDINAYAAEAADQGIQLVDVREKFEYDQGHIPGAVLVPLSSFRADFERAYPDKNQTVYLYCRSGNRSGQALNMAKTLGYKNIVNIGGIIDWKGATEK